MNETNYQKILAALERTDAYPWATNDVTPITTHISHVFLAGDRVIKLKRPIEYSFVDYSTLEKRHQACLDEVRLNRLLSDDIYLGVVPIVRDGASFRVGSPNEEANAVDWATLMRRIDDNEVLAGRLARGDVPDDLAERLAARLVPFHMEAAPECGGDPDDVLRTQTQVVVENLDELRPFVGNPLPSEEFDLVDRAMRSFMEERRELLESRIVSGWIREGHGDVRCEHVVVPDDGPIQLFDCVEFNRDLRCADIASDLAFLLMDLFRLGADPSQIRRLLERYDAAGADLPVGLLRFYWIHRALVRAKVQCLRLDGATEDERVQIAARVGEYVHVAARQALSTRPVLIAMTGLSGTGKSTVAADLARALGASRFQTDVVRKELAASSDEADAAKGKGIYTAEWTERTYQRLLALAGTSIEAGQVTLLDGTFLDPSLRERVATFADERGVPFILVETVTDEEVVIRRLEERAQRGDSVSDATVDIWRRQRERYEADPPVTPESATHITIDTSAEEPASLDDVLRTLVDAGVIEACIDESSRIEE